MSQLVSGPVDLRIVPPIEEPPGAYVSSDPAHAGRSFRAYASAADEFPDEHFDILLIDGRARPSTFIHGWPKVKIGGLVVLDDSQRPDYNDVVQFARAAGWRESRFSGPHPYGVEFSETTVWRKS